MSAFKKWDVYIKQKQIEELKWLESIHLKLLA